MIAFPGIESIYIFPGNESIYIYVCHDHICDAYMYAVKEVIECAHRPAGRKLTWIL